MTTVIPSMDRSHPDPTCFDAIPPTRTTTAHRPDPRLTRPRSSFSRSSAQEPRSPAPRKRAMRAEIGRSDVMLAVTMRCPLATRRCALDAGKPGSGVCTLSSRRSVDLVPGTLVYHTLPPQVIDIIPSTIKPQARRSSHRSSITSIGSHVSTPPEELSPQYTSRSSYGFPTPSEAAGWSSAPPRELDRRDSRLTPRSRQPSVLSWPQMEPAMTMPDERFVRAEPDRRMFEKGYTMGSAIVRREGSRPGTAFSHGRSRPPLEVAIHRRDSYYEP